MLPRPAIRRWSSRAAFSGAILCRKSRAITAPVSRRGVPRPSGEVAAGRELRARDQIHEAEAAGVVVGHRGAGAHRHHHVVVLGRALGALEVEIPRRQVAAVGQGHVEAAAHAEMHDQRLAGIERGGEVLRPAREARDGPALEAGGEALGEGEAQVGPAQGDAAEARADQGGRQSPPHGLDLGKLRHLSRGFRVRGARAPARISRDRPGPQPRGTGAVCRAAPDEARPTGGAGERRARRRRRGGGRPPRSRGRCRADPAPAASAARCGGARPVRRRRPRSRPALAGDDQHVGMPAARARSRNPVSAAWASPAPSRAGRSAPRSRAVPGAGRAWRSAPAPASARAAAGGLVRQRGGRARRLGAGFGGCFAAASWRPAARWASGSGRESRHGGGRARPWRRRSGIGAARPGNGVTSLAIASQSRPRPR